MHNNVASLRCCKLVKQKQLCKLENREANKQNTSRKANSVFSFIEMRIVTDVFVVYGN